MSKYTKEEKEFLQSIDMQHVSIDKRFSENLRKKFIKKYLKEVLNKKDKFTLISYFMYGGFTTLLIIVFSLLMYFTTNIKNININQESSNLIKSENINNKTQSTNEGLNISFYAPIEKYSDVVHYIDTLHSIHNIEVLRKKLLDFYLYKNELQPISYSISNNSLIVNVSAKFNQNIICLEDNIDYQFTLLIKDELYLEHLQTNEDNILSVSKLDSDFFYLNEKYKYDTKFLKIKNSINSFGEFRKAPLSYLKSIDFKYSIEDIEKIIKPTTFVQDSLVTLEIDKVYECVSDKQHKYKLSLLWDIDKNIIKKIFYRTVTENQQEEMNLLTLEIEDEIINDEGLSDLVYGSALVNFDTMEESSVLGMFTIIENMRSELTKKYLKLILGSESIR